MAGVPYGLIAPGLPETDAPVQLASVATLARPSRLERWRNRFDLIVVDEAHHSVAGSWARVIASQPRAKVLGVTATPARLDGRGLAEQFDVLVTGPQTADLIREEWLSDYVVYEPTATPDLSAARLRAGDFATEDLRQAMDGVVIGAAVTEYQRLCPGIPTVVFGVDVAHSQAVAQRFRDAGVRAKHVDGETPASDRRRAVAALGNGELEVLCNCSLFGEGVDVPVLGGVILLRPTASLALHLQMIGRALRPSAGKARAQILDFSGNCGRLGLPDEPRQWSLNSKPTRQRERSDGPRLRHCKTCSALNGAGAHSCANCGGDLRTVRERREIEIALEQAKRREEEDLVRSLSYRQRLEWAGGDERSLRLVERICGYKSGWAWHRLRELAEQRGVRANG